MLNRVSGNVLPWRHPHQPPPHPLKPLAPSCRISNSPNPVSDSREPGVWTACASLDAGGPGPTADFVHRRRHVMRPAGRGTQNAAFLGYDDHADLLGWHLLGLLSGIPERRGAPGAEPGRANGVRERACFDARAWRRVAGCEGGVCICTSGVSFALPDRLAAFFRIA